jgi:DNA polymerase-3 subunit beta
MKFRIAKDALVNGLTAIQGALPSKSPIPVLSNVLIEAGDGRITLRATDGELSIRTEVEATVISKGETSVPMKRLVSVARECATAEIEIDVDADEASISSGSATFRIKGVVGADEFPPPPSFQSAALYTVNREILIRMLQRTSYAASVDTGRQVLMGVNLNFEDQKLTVVATDGRRLALVDTEMEFPKDACRSVIVPTKAVNELIRSVEGEGPMRIRILENQIAFETETLMLMTKLVEGAYPNFRQVIPTSNDKRVFIGREELMNAVRRVSVLSSDHNIGVRLTFAKNKMEIFALVPDVGEAREVIAVKYDSKATTISYNPGFITDPLKNLVADTVYFEFNDEISPGVIKTDESFVYVIMPMRQD